MPKAEIELPVRCAVAHDDEPADAILDFANNSDVTSTTRWRVPHLDDQTLQARATDAREFALLAAKRWRHFRDTHCTARGIRGPTCLSPFPVVRWQPMK